MELPLVIMFLFGLWAGYLASSKGENGILWFIVGLIIGPFAVLLVFFTAGKRCISCQSKINKNALRCPKCGHVFN